MNVNQPLILVRKAANKGRVTVFTKKKVMICDENKIDIKLSTLSLVEGDRDYKGLWNVSSYKNKSPVLYSKKTIYTHETSQDLAMNLHTCASYPIIKA